MESVYLCYKDKKKVPTQQNCISPMECKKMEKHFLETNGSTACHYTRSLALSEFVSVDGISFVFAFQKNLYNYSVM